MSKKHNNCKPIVSVILPTYNRRQYLPQALASIVRQSYKSLQIIVINDGGCDVADIIESFNDSRLLFIDRKENRGKAFSLNQALQKAEGKYIAYLDDDDIYYPDHIETLVDCLENKTDCSIAYSDFYKAYCRTSPNGHREVLSKVVEVSRDFDRFFLLHFNHVLHVCLMHRRNLLEKTGLYNENINVLIDWDMTRRLSFFSDFYHERKVTGEYYHPMGESDRISVRRRKNVNEYLRNVLAIRSTRPPKPWPKVKDLSIICVCDRSDKQTGRTISLLRRHVFYPYKLYLPILQSNASRSNIDMPNLEIVPTEKLYSYERQVDELLNRCEGDYIAIIPSGFEIKEFALEHSVYALLNSFELKRGFLIEGTDDKKFSVVVGKQQLVSVRKEFPDLSLRKSLEAYGVEVRFPNPQELAFQFDELLSQAFSAQANGDWAQAAQSFQYISEKHHNKLLMDSLSAKAFFEAGDYERAEELCNKLNAKRPTVDTLLLEAMIKRKKSDYSSAVDLLSKAEAILQG